MDAPGLADGRIVWLEAKSKAGDSVPMRAEMDCYVVFPACPQDIVVISAIAPFPMAIDVLEGRWAAETSPAQIHAADVQG